MRVAPRALSPSQPALVRVDQEEGERGEEDRAGGEIVAGTSDQGELAGERRTHEQGESLHGLDVAPGAGSCERAPFGRRTS